MPSLNPLLFPPDYSPDNSPDYLRAEYTYMSSWYYKSSAISIPAFQC